MGSGCLVGGSAASQFRVTITVWDGLVPSGEYVSERMKWLKRTSTVCSHLLSMRMTDKQSESG